MVVQPKPNQNQTSHLINQESMYNPIIILLLIVPGLLGIGLECSFLQVCHRHMPWEELSASSSRLGSACHSPNCSLVMPKVVGRCYAFVCIIKYTLIN